MASAIGGGALAQLGVLQPWENLFRELAGCARLADMQMIVSTQVKSRRSKGDRVRSVRELFSLSQ
jgi:hypothetical protein